MAEKTDYQALFVGKELDDDKLRKTFREHLMNWHNEFTTPYWDCGFVNWLIYEGTIGPCGLMVDSIDRCFVKLHADGAGVQQEGICLTARFKVPTDSFTKDELAKMIGPTKYTEHGPSFRFEWFPKSTDRRVQPCYIEELEWYYDSSYDESDYADNED